MKDDPTLDTPNRVFIFGEGRPRPSIRAMLSLSLINAIGELVNTTSDINLVAPVVLVHNYNVSPAEHIIPAADAPSRSRWLAARSLASNMKFMMNGASLLGTPGWRE